ncbi:hypothetical protein PI95_000120 [Hassallia byssoidea VB512170]|uniref:Uncharacterized protein n=1 Tax=Hassallia byssoidea VB512170 TaxID=1304833 RepID=A0A846H356_9CYAN|nr:hypothetical protein [Hassalia byssoidea]NEU71021.1 hypothetical protein [Hassalia byssoidea VB512170]
MGHGGGSAVLGFHASSLKSASPPTRLAPQVEHLPSWGIGHRASGMRKRFGFILNAHCPLPIAQCPIP